MRRISWKTFLAAAVLSPLAATCSPPAGMLAQAQQVARTSPDDRLIAFLIDGEALPITTQGR